MQIVPRYARVFDEEYGVRFIYVRIMDSVNNMLSANLLTAHSRAIYVPYSRVVKTMRKHKFVLPLLMY